MKSKAHIKSHPIHQILVGFPIAFLTAALLFDILAVLYTSGDFHNTAYYLNIAGIAAGLIAAVPGIIDYRYTVPPESSAKKRAVKHGVLNTLVIILFAVALYLRKDSDKQTVIIAIESIGVILMLIAGWLGGTLVVRNQIGVDIRYADAGKWNEQYIRTDERRIAVAHTDELGLNQMKLIHLNDKRIVIANSDSGFAAFDDKCSHRGGSLAAGALICNTVQCPWHGSQFDMNTGSLVAGPGEYGIRTYPISISNGTVYLEL